MLIRCPKCNTLLKIRKTNLFGKPFQGVKCLKVLKFVPRKSSKTKSNIVSKKEVKDIASIPFASQKISVDKKARSLPIFIIFVAILSLFLIGCIIDICF